MKKLNALGIGPKIGIVAIPYLIVTILLNIYYKDLFYVGKILDFPLFVVGIILLIIGLIFYIITVRLLLKGLKNTTLMTTGTYYLCQNPLYAAIILMIIPGLSFVLHSWLILTTSIVAFVLFKTQIKSEYKELETFFGGPYEAYRKDTPEFLPFPWKKWLAK
jgi:protein-S-isoprenylcysteine O-methyltransferase Ste14